MFCSCFPVFKWSYCGPVEMFSRRFTLLCAVLLCSLPSVGDCRSALTWPFYCRSCCTKVADGEIEFLAHLYPNHEIVRVFFQTFIILLVCVSLCSIFLFSINCLHEHFNILPVLIDDNCYISQLARSLQHYVT